MINLFWALTTYELVMSIECGAICLLTIYCFFKGYKLITSKKHGVVETGDRGLYIFGFVQLGLIFLYYGIYYLSLLYYTIRVLKLVQIVLFISIFARYHLDETHQNKIVKGLHYSIISCVI